MLFVFACNISLIYEQNDGALKRQELHTLCEHPSPSPVCDGVRVAHHFQFLFLFCVLCTSGLHILDSPRISLTFISFTIRFLCLFILRVGQNMESHTDASISVKCCRRH